jgi:DNA-3-methyladenine glycosylase
MTNGPGKLCKALAIDKTCYGEDLCGSRLYLLDDEENNQIEICTSPRINIDYAEEAADFLWRFYIKEE